MIRGQERGPRYTVHSSPPNDRSVQQGVRQEQGLTQEQLADLSGFSQQYISGLEQGRRNPTVVSLYELAMALGVSHIELVRAIDEE
jgi:transcriptional regulator with XRE-family HTH domain